MKEDKILETIRCPICLEYMIPPIHQCIVGHSFCNSCKPKLNRCPTCRNPIGRTRNFTLEKVAETVTYHCLYKTEGCTFKTDYANILKHHTNCRFKMLKCILSEVINCKYVGSGVTMYQHCSDVHPNFVQQEDTFQMLHVPYFESFEVSLLKFDFGLMFKLRYAYNEVKVTCTVQCVSAPREDTIYMYEIQMMDLNNIDFQLKSKKLCAKLSEDKFDNMFCTIWHMDMIKPFISENNQIKFKCIISEKD